MKVYLAPLLWIAREYLQYNPFFIYCGKNPLLHQTEVVAKSLFIKPTRILIADAIGLGKTITALRILKTLNRYRRLNRVLIAVPPVLIDQWVDEMRSMGVNPQIIKKESLDFLAKHAELPAGWYIGSIDTLKRPEYVAILKRNSWDAIVIDEAHKLGIIGTRPNKRWLNLGEIIRSNRDAIVILLSATPHRGKANDYLARLALIDPSLLEVASVNTLERSFDKPEFYQRTHNTILFRRSKDDVNEVYERRMIFKPCNMLAVLIEPNEVERNLLRAITELATLYLENYYSYVTNALGWKADRVRGIIALLRTILVKRGLSSPAALIKTFSCIVEKRGRLIELIEKGYKLEEARKKVLEELEQHRKELEELLTGDVEDPEKELDDKFNEIASYFSKLLGEEFESKLREIKEYASLIFTGSVKDSKLETLKKILRLVLCASPSELPDEFRDLASGKAIVFTEFKDTAYYLYKRLSEWAEEELGRPDIVRVFTSENRDEIEDIKKWLSEEDRRVLITTDVAGEGLNLHYANVLINYEITWSPIKLEQRIGRVWRYGQNRVTYVFNLFLADALEKEVAEIVFAKLYGISISVGKLEPILGEKVYLSTIRNELLEHAIEERDSIGGLIPIEIEFREGKISLTETKIIELVTKDARAFVEAFIRALKKLVKEIKRKRVFPFRSDAEQIREELRCLTGFRDNEDVLETERIIAKTISNILNFEIMEEKGVIILRSRDGTVFELPSNPEVFLRRSINYFGPVEGNTRYFIFQNDRREVLLLSELEILIGGETRYKEPIGILADFETYEITILRGRMLVKKLSEILLRSIPVDEVHGLDEVLSAIPQIINAAYNTLYERELRGGAIKIIEMLREYEEVKKKLGGASFFNVDEPQVKINDEPVFVLISSAFLPETKTILSTEVWDWAEDEAIPIVLEYEERNGRQAIRVSSYEHYDVRSIKRGYNGEILEERFIEVKTKIRRSLSIELKESEFETAEKKGDKYWLYIVYGVGSEKPVILCIKNPVEKLPFKKRVSIEKREEYYFAVG